MTRDVWNGVFTEKNNALVLGQETAVVFYKLLFHAISDVILRWYSSLEYDIGHILQL